MNKGLFIVLKDPMAAGKLPRLPSWQIGSGCMAGKWW